MNSFRSLAFTGLLLVNFSISALEFEPGIGGALEYTSNAALTEENPQHDLIAIGYIGATLQENEGPLQADITASLNHHRYTQDTFQNQRYFNLGAKASWEMAKDRFKWVLQNIYEQRPIDVTDPNTPSNIQDTNAFVFGADMRFPITGRQTITLLPEFRDFYYEIQSTDNQQLQVAGGWNYKMNNLTSIGVDGSIRTVKYKEPVIDDVSFASIFFAISSIRARSDITANLGTTYVERENGQNTQEFAGYLNWLVNLTRRSRVWTAISSDLTDSSEGSLTATLNPDVGDPNNIQVTTDVIRNQIVALGYRRQDGTLESSLIGELRKINYSESPNDRRIWALDAVFNYPVTALLRSGFNVHYDNTDYLDQNRLDKNFSIRGTASYQLSRNFNSTFEAQYRDRDSDAELQSFNEWTVYVSLVYGFGQPLRPARLGNF